MESGNVLYQSFGIRDVLRKSISLYKNNISLLISISILGTLPALLEILFRKELNLTSFILSLASIFIGIWAYAALVVAASSKYRNNAITVGKCFAYIKGRYWRLIGVGISYYFIFIVGSLLFIIPGIYWGTVFWLSDLVVIIEERKEIGPFKFSKNLIQGNFWKAWRFMLIVSIPFALPVIPVLALNIINSKLSLLSGQLVQIFVMPFFVAAQVTLYYKLKEIKEEELSANQEANNKMKYGCLGIAGLVICIIVLSSAGISQLKKFIYSDVGYSITQKVIKKLSPPIVFPNGVTLNRPDERLVAQKTIPRLEYTLFHFKRYKGKTIAPKLFFYSLQDLGIKSGNIDLASPDVATRIYNKNYEFLSKNKFAKKTWEEKYGIYTTKSIKIVNLNNRQWGEHVLVANKLVPSIDTKGYVWKIYYTPVKDDMLIAGFGYSFNTKETQDPENPKGGLAEEEKMAMDIIKSIHFPK